MNRFVVLSLAFALLSACSSDDGEGTILVTAYGESFIEDGIPAADIQDGWAVDFDSFVVTVSDVTVAGVAVPVGDPLDLSQASTGAGHSIATVTVPAGDHQDASYTIARVELQGTATKGQDSKTFSWVFDEPTEYRECETTTSVDDGGMATFQITVHADHFLYDSLVSADPAILFQPIADADTDADGAVTQAELTAADLGTYDPGNEDVSDLWAWLVAQSRTLGHVDGEGHCHAHAGE